MNKQEQIPWYEKIQQSVFDEIVIETIKKELNISKKAAIKKYKELQEISIFDQRCKVKDDTYSFRFYVMEELEKINI